MFIILFITTGVGKGSTFRLIPLIFTTNRRKEVEGQDEQARHAARQQANMESAVGLGFTSTLAAYGAFIIPFTYGISISLTGGPIGAWVAIVLYYLTCVGVSRWFYSRQDAEVPC